MCINNSKQFAEISETLEKISSKYSEESKEHKALVLCAKAIWFIYSKNLQDTFMEYLVWCVVNKLTYDPKAYIILNYE